MGSLTGKFSKGILGDFIFKGAVWRTSCFKSSVPDTTKQGSGKSLFSSKLTESDYTVFDGDQHLTEFAKKYPETGSDMLSNAVNDQVFKVEKLKAITEQKSYAFETNFSSLNPMQTANEFRHAGYEIHLYFYGA